MQEQDPCHQFLITHKICQGLYLMKGSKRGKRKMRGKTKPQKDYVESHRGLFQLTTVMSSLSNHCSLSSARGHMSGLRADFIRLTQRRDSSSPGDPATLLASFTCRGKKWNAVFRICQFSKSLKGGRDDKTCQHKLQHQSCGYSSQSSTKKYSCNVTKAIEAFFGVELIELEGLLCLSRQYTA